MNFVECLSISFPTISVSCFSDPTIYENIVWESGNPLPTVETLLIANLINVKNAKIEELSKKCQEAIVGGFTSDALGTVCIYDSAEVDQLNLIGAVTSTSPAPGYTDGFPIYYATRPIVNGVTMPKVYSIHSHMQLRKVLQDGSVFKLIRLQTFNNKRDFIQNEATTVEQVLSINWE